MKIAEHPGKLILWRLYLWELDIRIEYRKCIKNTWAYGLSRLPTLRSAEISIDEEMQCLILCESEEEEEILPKETPWHEDQDEYPVDPDIEAFGLLILTSRATYTNEQPAMVQINLEDINLAHKTETFCFSIRNRINREWRILFNINSDTWLIFRAQACDEKLIVPTSFNFRFIRLSNYGKLSKNLGGRRLYKSLRR